MQRQRHGEAERLGGLHVDHQLKFGRLLNRQIRRLGAFEDLIDVAACTMEIKASSLRYLRERSPKAERHVSSLATLVRMIVCTALCLLP